MGRLGASDHEMILMSVAMQRGKDETEKNGLNWRKANWDGMREDLAAVDWRRSLAGLSTQEMWSFFKTEVEKTTEKNVPGRKRRSGGRATWMTKDIMAAVRRKKRLWKKAKNGANMDEYKEADITVKRMIRNAKRRFEKKLSTTQGGNSRPFYAYVKKKTKSRPAIGPLLDAANQRVTGDKEMAELLNNFFSSVFTREDMQNQPKAVDLETGTLEKVTVTEKAVREKIRNLKPFSAAGPDGIGPQLLQEVREEVIPALTTIFRQSLRTGEVPEDWRRANVTPIFKKGKKTDPGNYRPVSLTSVCCRILESIIRDDLMNHLPRNDLLASSQHGFMPNKSCCTNLLEFFEKVTSVIDQGNPFDVIFLDFAKAFDKVPKERLLEKLRAHGVQGELLE